ncbi:MAG: hypothetical protein R2794_09300 [Chitinophagales bacterium]
MLHKNMLLAFTFSISLMTMQAQDAMEQQVAKEINLSGPRVGGTYLGNVYVNALIHTNNYREIYGDAQFTPLISQFGWQFERRFFNMPDGSCGVIEFVPMVGGLDQNLVFPSLTTIIGARLSSGIEFGMGPVFTLAGSSVAFVAGYNVQSWGVNFPVNVAVTPSNEGTRITLLLGFNKKDDYYK